MSLPNQKGINRINLLVPEGVAIPAQWLREQGYSRQSLNQYKQRGYLLSPARGVYVLPGTELNWQGVVLGLQHLLKMELHVGGISALGMQGKAHYLPLGGEKQVHLWASTKLPAWVQGCGLQQSLVEHQRALFLNKADIGLEALASHKRDWQLRVSSPERAMFELCAELDDSETAFMFALEVMEGLSNLRPNLLNTLLQACTHVKAKRVFLCLAEHCQYAWWQKIDIASLELGSGKRQVVKNGKLNDRWQITVPKDFGGSAALNNVY